MKIKKSELKQLIKEEIEATMDEGILDFVTGGSFDAEAFKETMAKTIDQAYIPGIHGDDSDLEQQAEMALNSEYSNWIPDESKLDLYIKTLREKGPEKAASTVRTYLPHMSMAVSAALRAQGVADMLPRKNRKEWKAMSRDFNNVSAGQIKQWMDNNGKIAVQMNEITALIIAEYFHNAVFGADSPYNAPGAKERREFLNNFNPKGRQMINDIVSLYNSAIRGADLNDRDRSYLSSAFRSSNPVRDLSSEFPDSTVKKYIKMMEESGYHEIDKELYTILQSFNTRDIISRYESNKSMFLR
jgi:hypothetical protein